MSGFTITAKIAPIVLLIFLVLIIGSQLWVILLVLVAFSWPGLTIVVRSMVLQLRDGPEVEAAKALGASSPRIRASSCFIVSGGTRYSTIGDGSAMLVVVFFEFRPPQPIREPVFGAARAGPL